LARPVYCVGADVKPCSINQSTKTALWVATQDEVIVMWTFVVS